MGLLSTAPEGVEVDTSAEEADDAPETQALPADAKVEAAKPVPLPDKPLGRRAAAAAERAQVEKQLAELRENFTKTTEASDRRAAEQERLIARLTGTLESMQQQGQRPQQQQQAPSDPDALLREANKLLDSGDFGGYQQKLLEVAESRALARMRTEMPRQQQAPGVDPRVQMVIMGTPGGPRVYGHEAGEETVQFFYRDLGRRGVADGPDRLRAAIERAEQHLFGGKQQQSQFPTSNREALAGVPTGRTNGAAKNAGPQVRPPDGWEKWASLAGMSKDEYLRSYAENHPEAVTDE